MDQTDIYWATVDSVGNGAIWKCPKAGCNGVPVAVETSTATETGAAQIALDVDMLFFEEGKMFACAKSGCGNQPTVLDIATDLYAPGGVATDGVNLFWTEARELQESGPGDGAGVVRKCSINGCNNSPTIIATGLTNPKGIVVDSQNVYWVESGVNQNHDGRVWKAPK